MIIALYIAAYVAFALLVGRWLKFSRCTDCLDLQLGSISRGRDAQGPAEQDGTPVCAASALPRLARGLDPGDFDGGAA